MSGMSDEQLPVAYCAPGLKPLAALVLALRGEQVSEIVEHSWLLEGYEDTVIVAGPPPVFEIPPFQMSAPPAFAAAVVRDQRLAAEMRSARPLVINTGI
jgi:hypothetical protein